MTQSEVLSNALSWSLVPELSRIRPLTVEAIWTDLESKWGPISLRELEVGSQMLAADKAREISEMENYLLKMGENIMELLEGGK